MINLLRETLKMATKKDDKLLLIATVLKQSTSSFDIKQLQEKTKLPISAINRSVTMNNINKLDIVLKSEDGLFSYNPSPIASITYKRLLKEAGKTEDSILLKSGEKTTTAKNEKSSKKSKNISTTKTKPQPKPRAAKNTTIKTQLVKSETITPTKDKPSESSAVRQLILDTLEIKPHSLSNLATLSGMPSVNVIEGIVKDLADGGVVSSKKIVNTIIYQLAENPSKTKILEKTKQKPSIITIENLDAEVITALSSEPRSGKEVSEILNQSSVLISKTLATLHKQGRIEKSQEAGPSKFYVKEEKNEVEPISSNESSRMLCDIKQLICQMPKSQENDQQEGSLNFNEHIEWLIQNNKNLESSKKAWENFGSLLTKIIEQHK